MARRARWAALALALVAVGVVALRPTSSPQPAPTGAGGHASPAAMVALRHQANQLLGGGPAAFRARLAALRGFPIVVNQWASWCGPCRFEFPFFQRLAHKYADRVAFLGVDTQDAEPAARRFLRERPVPYPHYLDPDISIARTFHGGRAWPTTVFYDAKGALTYSHPGAYATQAVLDRDIQRYAIHG